MAIVSMNFTKLLAERKTDAREKVNISNNVAVTNVEEAELPLAGQSQKTVKISFAFTTSYEPNLGTIQLEGNLLYIGDAKEMKEIAKNWEKDKRLSAEMMKQVISAVLNKCNIQALVMSKDVNLPPPVPLPKVNIR